MKIYFVRELCESESDMEFQMELQEEMGSEIIIVDRLVDVPKNAVYFNGAAIQPNVV